MTRIILGSSTWGTSVPPREPTSPPTAIRVISSSLNDHLETIIYLQLHDVGGQNGGGIRFSYWEVRNHFLILYVCDCISLILYVQYVLMCLLLSLLLKLLIYIGRVV